MIEKLHTIKKNSEFLLFKMLNAFGFQLLALSFDRFRAVI